jgi:peptidoglycan/LPS O-acetylase OafA/YrhL
LVYFLSPRVLIRVCLIGFIIALPLRILVSAWLLGDSVGLIHITLSRVDGLFLGSACALFTHMYKRPVPINILIAGLSLGISIVAFIAVFHHAELTSTSYWILTIGITAYGLISGSLVGLSQHRFPALQIALTNPLLTTLGKYSYGIYVYHLLVLVPFQYLFLRHSGLVSRLNFLERTLLLLMEYAVVFIVAKVSFDQFESRFLRLKSYFPPSVGPSHSAVEHSSATIGTR